VFAIAVAIRMAVGRLHRAVGIGYAHGGDYRLVSWATVRESRSKPCTPCLSDSCYRRRSMSLGKDRSEMRVRKVNVGSTAEESERSEQKKRRNLEEASAQASH
jgi:hypothetical protein